MLVAVAAVAAVVAAIAAGLAERRAGDALSAPTWAQVAPIFASKCAGCHTPGGIAPFSLRNAKTAAAYADRILTMTQLGKMPPWMPGHDSPAFLGQSAADSHARREAADRTLGSRRRTDRQRRLHQARWR